MITGFVKLSQTPLRIHKRGEALSITATTRITKGLIMVRLLKQFSKDQSGATAIEYGLIAAGISVAIIAAVQTLGSNLNATFSSVSSALK